MVSLNNRRGVIRSASAFLGGALLGAASPQPAPLKVAIFSKHLQFLSGEALAKTAAGLGFDGVDLTVRKGGHVEPSRVATDLPPLVGLLRRQNLEVPMLTTDIVDTGTPYAEDILRCMNELSIHRYRWGGFEYSGDAPLSTQLDALKPRIAKLAGLNARYGVTAMYHTHSGFNLVGAPIWDLHELLSSFDPNAVSINYDVGHATVEGGFGGWIDSFRIARPYLRGVAVKDFLWTRNNDGEWRPEWHPLGQGMVDFPKFFSLLASAQFSGPLQLHFEYPLEGAEEGSQSVSNSTRVFDAMRRDLRQLRRYLSKAGLA